MINILRTSVQASKALSSGLYRNLHNILVQEHLLICVDRAEKLIILECTFLIGLQRMLITTVGPLVDCKSMITYLITLYI